MLCCWYTTETAFRASIAGQENSDFAGYQRKADGAEVRMLKLTKTRNNKHLDSAASEDILRRSKDHRLCSGLMLGRHPVAHRHSGVLPTSLLLLLKILVVGHLLLLFVGHVAWVHARRARNVLLLGIDIVVGGGDILWRLCWHITGLDTVLIGGGIGGIETGLS